MEYTLRKLLPKDAQRMLAWMQNENVTTYLRVSGARKKIEDMEEFIAIAINDKNNSHYAIVDDNDTYMGTVSLKNVNNVTKEAEYAIALHCDAIGHGISTIATDLVIKIAFTELNLKRIFLNVLQENSRAVKFYEKYGFTYTHTSEVKLAGVKRKMRWYEYINEKYD